MRQDFICQRCGLCCSNESELTWVSGPTWDEKQILIAERKKYPETKGCGMLVPDGCLVEIILGKERKQKGCSSYPDGRCMREEQEWLKQ